MSFSPVVGLEKAGVEVYKAKHGDDGNLYAEFHVKKQTLPIETEKAGEIVTRDVVFIKIFSPGDKTKIVERKARLSGEWFGNVEADDVRFAAQFARFKAGQKQLADGTPLEELGLGESEIKAYNIYNILTIEHLINVPDGLIQDLPIGTRAIIEAGKKYLEKKREKAGETDSLKAENESLKARLAALEQRFAELDDQPVKQKRTKETLNANSN